MNVVKRSALVLVGALLFACGSGPESTVVKVPAPAPTPAPVSLSDELDAAIRETSDYLNKQLPKGNKLVILNIQSDFPALSEYIIDELIANTVNDRVFSVVDRQQLNTIRAELNFQMSSEVDDKTAQSVGQMAGAQIIVSGAVSKIGPLYRLRVRALSVQSAEITGQFNRNIMEGATIAALVESKATGYGESSGRTAAAATSNSAGKESAEREAIAASPLAVASVPAPALTSSATPAAAPAPTTAAIPRAAPAPTTAAIPKAAPASTTAAIPKAAPAPTTPVMAAQKVYNIGNTGLGGGIVFYAATKVQMPPAAPPAKAPGEYRVGDKGPAGGLIFYVNPQAGEWKYLEAAPVETEEAAQWGAFGSNVGGTATAVGTGKQNTALITRSLRVYSESGKAAQLCDGLSYGGYDDWFLPSKDELALMYTVLVEKGLDVFYGAWYWSSSQINLDGAWVQAFNTGVQSDLIERNYGRREAHKDNSQRIRAIRQF